MALLNELKPGVLIKGLLPGNTITIVEVKRHGDIGVELIYYKDSNGIARSCANLSSCFVHILVA